MGDKSDSHFATQITTIAKLDVEWVCPVTSMGRRRIYIIQKSLIRPLGQVVFLRDRSDILMGIWLTSLIQKSCGLDQPSRYDQKSLPPKQTNILIFFLVYFDFEMKLLVVDIISLRVTYQFIRKVFNIVPGNTHTYMFIFP